MKSTCIVISEAYSIAVPGFTQLTQVHRVSGLDEGMGMSYKLVLRLFFCHRVPRSFRNDVTISA